MRPWRRELIRHMRRPMGQGRPWRRPVPAVPPFAVTLTAALLVAASAIALMETRLHPVAAEIAAAQAQNAMAAVVEGAVAADLAARQINYGDFITIQRDEQGAITALTTDMARMNLLRTQLTAAILEALEEADVSVIQVPLGSLFNLESLWARGPALKARSITVGTVRSEFDSQFTSAGVNQTLHRIWLEVSVPMTLMLPSGAVEVSLDTRLRVAETVIVGQVPDTYLQLGDMAVKS